jgi:spore coat protein CotH
MIGTQFTGGGNLYKPNGQAATFAAGSYNINQFYKKTNIETNDYSDVKALYDALNSSLRSTSVETWRAGLESVFDVQHFLKWLAANTVIQNWDTYGKMSHNYYLYNNPATNKLTWIPWDNNEALNAGKQGGALSLGFTEIQNGWPLIRYIANDNIYKQAYKGYLASFIQTVFNIGAFQQKVEQTAQLIRQYAVAEVQGSTFLISPYPASFDNAVAALKQHVVTRNQAVTTFLAK